MDIWIDGDPQLYQQLSPGLNHLFPVLGDHRSYLLYVWAFSNTFPPSKH